MQSLIPFPRQNIVSLPLPFASPTVYFIALAKALQGKPISVVAPLLRRVVAVKNSLGGQPCKTTPL